MRFSVSSAPTSLAMLGVLFSLMPAQGVDLNGAWANDASVCTKVFVKSGNIVSFTPDAELYGAGLIVEGTRATGTFQKCTIKSMKNEGGEIHLIAACSTGVMVSDVPVTVKFVGEDRISLTQSGPTPFETPYVRCRL